jgi:hypothetical protein
VLLTSTARPELMAMPSSPDLATRLRVSVTVPLPP